MDDARLCLANILQAISFGAVCCNYVRLRALNKADGQLCGAVVEDLRSAHVFEVKANVVVNATGPWSDLVRRLSDKQAGTRLAPTKGIHLIVPRLTQQALFVQTRHDDRRMIFLLPWGDYSLIGTTESSDFASLDELSATAHEVEYLLAEVHRILPRVHLEVSDIVATYAGARPLLAFSGSATGASREHRIEVDRFGLVSVMGGKYTTFRVMAKQAVDGIVRRFRLHAERCLTDQISLLEPTHPVVLDRWQDVTKTIAPELLSRLLMIYGTGAFRILQLLEFEPRLATTVCPHHEVIQAELVYAIQEELACTMTDVLARRTQIAYSACQGLDMLSVLTDLLKRYSRISDAQLHEQFDDYRRFLAQSLAFRPALGEPHLAPVDAIQ
jgi:glycerol-3-phosphate dehydrogenase